MPIRGPKRNPHNITTGPQVGDVLPHPTTPGESFTVTSRTKRYVAGQTAAGDPVGETGIGIFENQRLA